MGIYLGPSQTHASNVALILNAETGLTSPQFHIQFDERFETIKTNPKLKGLSQWQTKTQIKQKPSGRTPRKLNCKRQRIGEPLIKPIVVPASQEKGEQKGEQKEARNEINNEKERADQAKSQREVRRDEPRT